MVSASSAGEDETSGRSLTQPFRRRRTILTSAMNQFPFSGSARTGQDTRIRKPRGLAGWGVLNPQSGQDWFRRSTQDRATQQEKGKGQNVLSSSVSCFGRGAV